MMNLEEKLTEAEVVVREAIARYQPSHVFVLFSGGHDSFSVTHFAIERWPRIPVVQLNTGIGLPKTRQFVQETAARQRWQLLEYQTPVRYEEIVLREGFPGPPRHNIMYALLKERFLRQLVRTYKQHRADRIMLISGVRQQESLRRMRHLKPLQQEGAKLWVAPFWKLSKLEVNEYLGSRRLARSPVVDLIHKSGECLCGAFAKKGELKELSLWFPDTAAYIQELEQRVMRAGFPWGWEERPAKQYLLEQQGQGRLFAPLCASCELGGEG